MTMNLGKISFQLAQRYLVALWVGSFACVMATVALTYLLDWIGATTAIASAQSVSKLYAPYVGAVVAYGFAARRRTRQDRSRGPVGLALLGTVLWNLPILVLFMRHLSPVSCEPGQNCIQDTLPVAVAWGEYCGVAVAPTLGYYFGKQV